MNSDRSYSPTVPGEAFAAEPAPPDCHGAPRETLLRRIDEELAQLGDIELSSWMVGLQSEAATGDAEGEATAAPASEIEVDIALAATLMQARGGQRAHACVHLLAEDGVLVAIYQPASGEVAVRDGLTLRELSGLRAQPRPAAAAAAPANWRATSLPALLWRYAQFAPLAEQLLPRHWRELPLRWHGYPPLPRTLVAGRHVRLMQLLQQRDHRFDELHALTGLSEGQLLRDLAALRMVGSITPA